MQKNVSFDEEPQILQKPELVPSERKSVLTSFVIACGLAKNDKDSQVVLLIIAIVCLFLAVIIWVLASMSFEPTTSQAVLNANAKLLKDAPPTQ